ncbi:MAG TPA: TIGR03790 family protein, partial [Phycisphaerales bacterium]|nr:TIGR03790 family protein [Phycisphaerales bacterium]
MTAKVCTIILTASIFCSPALALEPDEILVIANADVAESVQVARHYSSKRAVPEKNILELPLGAGLRDTISRQDYEKRLAEPIRRKFFTDGLLGRVKCLLTVYGVPVRVGGRGPLPDHEDRLKELESLAGKEREKIEQLEDKRGTRTAAYKQASTELAKLNLKIDHVNGRETGASVDSELALALFKAYELYRWQPNMLK